MLSPIGHRRTATTVRRRSRSRTGDEEEATRIEDAARWALTSVASVTSSTSSQKFSAVKSNLAIIRPSSRPQTSKPTPSRAATRHETKAPGIVYVQFASCRRTPNMVIQKASPKILPRLWY